ncbi:MAG: hypothetical protein ACOC9Z_07375, partial [Chloroflexota bacterium]
MSTSHVKSRFIPGLLTLALLAIAALLVGPAGAQSIEVDRAELDDGELRVEGEGAVPDAPVTVSSAESTAGDEADGDGEFRVRTTGFESSTCEVTVGDGVSSVQVTLSDCTPSANPTATPTSEPTATSEPTVEPTATATSEPTVEPTATNTPEPTTEPTATATAEATATATPQPTATATPEEEEEPEPRIESLVFDPNPVPGGEP